MRNSSQVLRKDFGGFPLIIDTVDWKQSVFWVNHSVVSIRLNIIFNEVFCGLRSGKHNRNSCLFPQEIMNSRFKLRKQSDETSLVMRLSLCSVMFFSGSKPFTIKCQNLVKRQNNCGKCRLKINWNTFA